jgi:hypothetical protein
MTEGNAMQDHEALRELARARTREELRTSRVFPTLDVAEQKTLFQDVYASKYRELARAHGSRSGNGGRGMARAMFTPPGPGTGKRSDRRRSPSQPANIDQAGDSGSRLHPRRRFSGISSATS